MGYPRPSSALRETAPRQCACVHACVHALCNCEILHEGTRGELRSRNRAGSEISCRRTYERDSLPSLRVLFPSLSLQLLVADDVKRKANFTRILRRREEEEGKGEREREREERRCLILLKRLICRSRGHRCGSNAVSATPLPPPPSPTLLPPPPTSALYRDCVVRETAVPRRA